VTDFNAGQFAEVDAAARPQAFIDFLDRMRAHESISRGKDWLFRVLDLGPGDRFLDLGCGPGDDAIRGAATVGPGGRAIGIDSSSTMVEEAGRRALEWGSAAEFSVADAHALPFPNESFDAVLCDRVLEHVKDPARVIEELARVAARRGRVAIAEIDHELAAVDIEDLELRRAVHRAQMTRIRNPVEGRRLARHLRQAGLSNIAIEGRVHIWADAPPIEAIAAELRALNAAGELADSEAAAYLNAVRAAANDGTYLFAGVFFYAIAIKPEA
jgi:ubiquinone/menaquinone biosynthesis C-methylase UbiE